MLHTRLNCVKDTQLSSWLSLLNHTSDSSHLTGRFYLDSVNDKHTIKRKPPNKMKQNKDKPNATCQSGGTILAHVVYLEQYLQHLSFPAFCKIKRGNTWCEGIINHTSNIEIMHWSAGVTTKLNHST